MDKLENPYKPGTLIRDLLDGDWSGMTKLQIAKKLHCDRCTVSQYMRKIERETGYRVPHADGRKRGQSDGQ